MTQGKYAARQCSLSAAEAKAEAQRIAFGPLVFHAVAAMKELGLLALLWERRAAGCRIEEAAEALGLSTYAVTVLFESTLSAHVLDVEDDRFCLSKVGYFLERDELTTVNFGFVRDVCYGPMMQLTSSLREGRPAGLDKLSDRPTVYEALLSLPASVLQSWLAFDHFYSDRSFDAALGIIAAASPRRLLDLGANTGKFAAACLAHFPDLHVTLVDHPAQLERAAAFLDGRGLRGRYAIHPADLLKVDAHFPAEMDGVWISQLLDCFSEAHVETLLRKVSGSLHPGGRVYILEPCWDLQPQESGQFCLLQTSLYFTCVANGESRMYDSQTLERLVATSGLVVEERIDGLGVGHSLFVCRLAETGAPAARVARQEAR